MFVRGRDLEETPTAHGEKLPIKKRVFIRQGQVSHLTQLARSRYFEKCSTEVDLHVHSTMWEIYFVLKGKARHVVGDQEFVAEEGDVVAVPPNTTHYYEVIEMPHELLYFGIATDE
jgi:mannose-6-phosphate isomerase-like protein (cupin superfamily)